MLNAYKLDRENDAWPILRHLIKSHGFANDDKPREPMGQLTAYVLKG